MPKRQRTNKSSASGANPLSDARAFKQDVAKSKGHQNKSIGGLGDVDANDGDSNTSNGVAVIKNVNLNSKADQNAQSLWHRKSGAGFSLFLSYYGSQPEGVVSPILGNDFSIDSENFDVTKSPDMASLTNKGMSRAAKRRQKKRAKISSVVQGEESYQAKNATTTCNIGNNSTAESPEKDDPNKQQPVVLDSSHPLVQAYTSKLRKQHPHLEQLVHTLSKPLPLTFRIRQHDPSISKQLAISLSSLHNNAKPNEKTISQMISPVSYDPTQSIYQSTPNSKLSKSNLSKISPQLKEFLITHSMNGTLARQELGSMLPVLCLSAVGAMVPGSKVLDLCASPGSKTMQALEIVASWTASADATTTTTLRKQQFHSKDDMTKTSINMNDSKSKPRKGKVIANDVHPGRLASLQDAVARSGLPTSLTSLVTYTNFDASTFPFPKSNKLFHSIICDVPCSGDGTIRKDEHILPNWMPRTGNALHGLQLRILRRALDLVRVGGVVCYSTCSLNPVEDEAVVSAALRGKNRINATGADGSSDGFGSGSVGQKEESKSFEVVDWPEGLLPGFVRRPGVIDWRVAFYDENRMEFDNEDFGSLTFCETYNEAREKGFEDCQATFWPDHEWNGGLNLDKCIRLFPQDHDSGGFFLALLRRLR
ncbi:hypothetical protein ACHAXS_006672 [Conticribra weissflogii]